MQTAQYTDISIKWATFLMRICGVWLTENRVEKRKRYIYVVITGIAIVYGVYVNCTDVYYTWGDLGHCIFLINNTLCIFLAIFKLCILTKRKGQFSNIIQYARQNFWHLNYKNQEKILFARCQKFCKVWIITICFLAQASLAGYAITPIVANIGKNKSDRIFAVNMWVDLPLSMTPYYEITFTFQILCVYQIGAAYVCTDTLLCMLNMYVILHFRILQHKLSSLMPINDHTEETKLLDEHYTAVRKCIRYHQSLIGFCSMLENVYSLPILGHMVVFSLLMCFDTYEILLADIPTVMRFIFVFHMIGSFIHIIFFTYSCHGLLEESTNVCTATYSSWWSTLPMNRVGKMLRRDVQMIMTRSQRPCCLTAGGFFPVSLETATALMGSTMSYFTLMRESSERVSEGN
ncbi:unnamed protein product [Xylocopa violacea]|uniref:Odorant receptor n=1 Tax=Xylocopa violacea TaxID=135666 RepID=A0ABP1N977_XYLVO